MVFSGGYGTAAASAFRRADAPTLGSGDYTQLELRNVEFILNITKNISLFVINWRRNEDDALEVLALLEQWNPSKDAPIHRERENNFLFQFG